MRGVKVFTGAAAAVLLMAIWARRLPWPIRSRLRWCAPIRTIRSSMRSARRCGPPTKTCRRRCRAIVRRSRSPPAPAINIPIRNTTSGGSPTQIVRTEIHGANAPRSVGATVTQTLYNGNQTANRTRAAESQVSGAREALAGARTDACCSRPPRSTWTICATAAIVEVQKSNVRVLEQTLKQTQDRFNVGEVTRTDVAQSEAQLAAGKTQQLTAESNLTTTRANFRRIIGNEPEALAPGSPVDRFLPATLPARGRTQPDRKSERHRRDVRHRRQLSPGQGQRRRAAARR